jgi:hypothetical protein
MRRCTTILVVFLTFGFGRQSDPRSADHPTPMPRTSKFTFDGREYPIGKAEIVAAIGDPYWCDTYNHGAGKSIAWSISFEAKTAAGELSPPSVDFDGIQIDVKNKNWRDLVGYKTQWNEPINPKTDERYGLTYLSDHLLISNGQVQITNRQGAKFQIVASGKDEEGQQFAINAPAEFKGIYVRGSERDSDETIRARLKQYIDDANLTGTPFTLDRKYDSGVRMGQSFYSPTTD